MLVSTYHYSRDRYCQRMQACQFYLRCPGMCVYNAKTCLHECCADALLRRRDALTADGTAISSYGAKVCGKSSSMYCNDPTYGFPGRFLHSSDERQGPQPLFFQPDIHRDTYNQMIHDDTRGKSLQTPHCSRQNMVHFFSSCVVCKILI